MRLLSTLTALGFLATTFAAGAAQPPQQVEIPLDELKYWSVDLQEAYAVPSAVLQRHFPGALKTQG